jgi:hypothetical protein
MIATAARRMVPIAVFGLAVVCFLPALGGEFLNWDDRENLVQNTGFRGLGWAQLRWMFTATVLGHYIPLTWMSFGVNYVLGGMNPWGYHMGNLLLHGANAALVYFVARRLLVAGRGEGAGGSWRMTAAAAFGALVFGLHPLRVESVAWITERRDVLCGFFFLLAVLAWLRAVERPGRAEGWWQGLSLAAFAASLLSKAAAMPLPAVLVLLDVYPLGRVKALGWRRLLLEKLPHAVLAGAAAGLSLIALRISTVSVTSYREYGVGARVGMTAYSLVFYPWKFLWPPPLSPIYELPVRVDPLARQFLVPLIVLIAVTAVLVALRRRWPGGLAAWVYSALMVLPVSGIVHAGFQLAHDRYSYLSGLGFAVLAGGALGWMLEGSERGRRAPLVGLLTAGAFLIVLLWGADSWRQSRLWRDSETLWRWAVDVDPGCALCRSNLGGQILYSRPDSEADGREAELHLRRAIALRPQMAVAYYNLGIALQAQRRYAEAEAAYREYTRRAPNVPEGAAALGLLLLAQGRSDEALPILRRAVELSPGNSSVPARIKAALDGHAAALARAGRADEAAVPRREAAAIRVGGHGSPALPVAPAR